MYKKYFTCQIKLLNIKKDIYNLFAHLYLFSGGLMFFTFPWPAVYVLLCLRSVCNDDWATHSLTGRVLKVVAMCIYIKESFFANFCVIAHLCFLWKHSSCSEFYKFRYISPYCATCLFVVVHKPSQKISLVFGINVMYKHIMQDLLLAWSLNYFQTQRKLDMA